MKSNNSDVQDEPEKTEAGDKCSTAKKKKPDKNSRPDVRTDESPEEDIDLETGLPPMKW